MRSTILFVTGILVGLAFQGVSSQPRRDDLMLNHVAITVPDLDEAIRFYVKALGAKEAFTFRGTPGRTPFSYLQLSRNTFLELQPTVGGRPPGLLHIGLEVTDLRAALPQFTARGLVTTTPRESQLTKALIAQATGQDGLRFELLEFGPDSLQRKVIEGWKP